MQPALYDWSPTLRLLIAGALLGCVPLVWVVWRFGKRKSGWVHALTVTTLFLTFDLVLFGAFTRLTDSGLGCPDWPGCYGSASPFGAQAQIDAAQRIMPSGPVTTSKAWIEMVHRYFATGVGFLVTVLAVVAWLRPDPQNGAGRGLTLFTLFWVCMQGAFGALTVTMKLFPVIVTLHLLGGLGLLALLTLQVQRQTPVARNLPHIPPPYLHRAVAAGLGLLVVQAASGAWVSSNYAVLACTQFPLCQGVWWPQMDFPNGFSLWRPLGLDFQGKPLPLEALTAIHIVHRLLAIVTLVALAALAWRLHTVPQARNGARALGALLMLQLITGLSNVVLDWPMLAAVLHTGGAGAMVVVLVAVFDSVRVRLPSSAHNEMRAFA